MLSFKHIKFYKAWSNIAYSLYQISNLNIQASRFRTKLEWQEAKCLVKKQRLLWWSASIVFLWLELPIELTHFKCNHDVTWRLLRHRKAVRHCVLLELKDDSQNVQFENTNTVLIGLMMHGLTIFLIQLQAWHDYSVLLVLKLS